ncbi:MAG: molybdopterin-dependent oxidoreductase [Candidatus Marinimicrobia bacterium]|nr:molybdopterin-dependent oxidoreductase [Candidatus Neomarinimicrobiota bacterium]
MSKKRLLTRTEFLKYAGIITGGIGLSASMMSQVFGLSNKTIQKLKQGPGLESWANTTCRLCPGGCGLTVRRIDGIPISLKGNSLSPINRGGVCPAAHANLELLFHPDRYTEPLTRPEGRLRKTLNPTSWEETFPSVAKNVRELTSTGQGHKIAIINGDNSPLMKHVWQEFANQIGTPNFYQENDLGLTDNSCYATQGIRRLPMLDLINSECIISLGSNFLEEDGSPVHFNQVYSEFKDVENVTRNKLIYVGPRANITATSAHKWIPIYPDTWGALALGIAHILIEENAIDTGYLKKYANGYFDETDKDGNKRIRFETQVRTIFHPKYVEEITGIPEKEIRYLAELLATRRHSVVLCGREALQSPRGDLHQWAVHCLNFITGNLQNPGGWYFKSDDPYPVAKPVSDNENPIANLFKSDGGHPLEAPSIDMFAKRVEGYAPYNIELLIINKANPCFHGENRVKWRATLKHIPRVIYLGDLPNETSKYADVIFPTHSDFESWDLVENIPGLPMDSLSVQKPVISPMYGTRSGYEVVKEIASQAGISTQQIFSAKMPEDLVRTRMKQIHAQKRGAPFESLSQKEWKSAYKNHKSLKGGYTETQFLKTTSDNGGWWDPAIQVQHKLDDVIKTPSGKFEMLPETLTYFEGYSGDESQILKNLLAAKKYPSGLIQYETSGRDEFPLTLISGYPITNPFGRTVYSPTMLETIGIRNEIYWESWAEIHPATARKFGLKNGDTIQLVSHVGKEIHVKARVKPIIHPDVVFVPLGLGRIDVGRYGTGIGSDPRELMVPQPEVSTGLAIVSGTPIRITLL